MNLKELRAQWELGLKPVVEIPIGETALTVVLQHTSKLYSVHHYFKTGPTAALWTVSVDVCQVPGVAALHVLARRHPPKKEGS